METSDISFNDPLVLKRRRILLQFQERKNIVCFVLAELQEEHRGATRRDPGAVGPGRQRADPDAAQGAAGAGERPTRRQVEIQLQTTDDPP